MARRRATGSLATEQRHGSVPEKKDRVQARLPGRLRQAADATLAEHAFTAEVGGEVSLATMSRAIATLPADDPAQAVTPSGRPGRPLKGRACCTRARRWWWTTPAHKPDRIRAPVEAAGCLLVFLPAYSLASSPVEEAASLLETLIRAAAARSRAALDAAIAVALAAVTAADAADCFAGYPIRRAA
ncbi:hypothetical protein [Geodermatophilus sp. URMC 62]|uniref:hypothetical protein n=1 Tax=Geodermatophilus sp. URMC 62 TaxID=3423414 RepID=UPI00406C992C